MPALRQRFLLHRTTQAHLAESGRVRRELAGSLVCRRPVQGLGTLQGFSQTGVVHPPPRFQPFEQDRLLRQADRQRDLGDEGGCFAAFHSDAFLVLDGWLDDVQRCPADHADNIGMGPQRRHAAFESWILLPQPPGAVPFQRFDQSMDPKLGSTSTSRCTWSGMTSNSIRSP